MPEPRDLRGEQTHCDVNQAFRGLAETTDVSDPSWKFVRHRGRVPASSAAVTCADAAGRLANREALPFLAVNEQEQSGQRDPTKQTEQRHRESSGEAERHDHS